MDIFNFYVGIIIVLTRRKDSILESSMFWLFFLLNLMAYSCFTIAVSISDALCFDILKEKHYQYGAQRVWGSIGWGIFTVRSVRLYEEKYYIITLPPTRLWLVI